MTELQLEALHYILVAIAVVAIFRYVMKETDNRIKLVPMYLLSIIPLWTIVFMELVPVDNTSVLCVLNMMVALPMIRIFYRLAR